jgi:hypothetical protein
MALNMTRSLAAGCNLEGLPQRREVGADGQRPRESSALYFASAGLAAAASADLAACASAVLPTGVFFS